MLTHRTWRVVLRLPGRRVWVEQAGAGRTVVFLHAAIGDRRMWDGQVATLAGRYHVVRYDQPGWGRSPTATQPYSSVEEFNAVCWTTSGPRPPR